MKGGRTGRMRGKKVGRVRRPARGRPPIARSFITHSKIDVDGILRSVGDGGAGAVALFLGRVRDNSEVGEVDKIVYETYAPMAEKRFAQIEEEVRSRWPVRGMAMVHRVGTLSVGDISVAVAVSTPHRAESFEACRHAMERIKHEAPIWKRERLADGSESWVAGQSMGPLARRTA